MYRGQTGEAVYVEIMPCRDGEKRVLRGHYGEFTIGINWEAVRGEVGKAKSQLVAQRHRLTGQGGLIVVLFNIDREMLREDEETDYEIALLFQEHSELGGMVFAGTPRVTRPRLKLLTHWSPYPRKSPMVGSPLPDGMFDEPHIEDWRRHRGESAP